MTTTDLIARYYACFNRADWERMLGLLSEDVVHDLNQGRRESGREAFRAFLARMARCYLEVLTDIRVLASADGSHAAAEYVVNGQYLSRDEGLPPASGQRYRLPAGAFFDVKDGRITRVSNHYNLEDWLAQVR
jgi:steroid delta-isomerase-like uncharacterized protein